MKKLPILQIALIVLLVGVIAFGFFMTKKNSNREESSKTQTETTDSDAVDSWNMSLYEAEQKQLQKKMDDYALYNSAVDTLDIGACEKIVENDTLKAECLDNVYSAQASKEKNATLCENIQDATTKSRCEGSFAYDFAVTSGKQSDCDKIIGDSDLKNACAKNIVFTKIEDVSFSGTVDTCNTLSGVDKDYCINRIRKDADIDLLQKGTNTKDIKICGQIQDAGMRNTCNDTVYMTLAMEKQDGLLCAKIVDTARKTNCTTQFIRINDVTILSKALAENSLSLCATITTPDLKTKCNDTLLLKLWITNKDTAICAKISDAGTRKQCDDSVKLILK